MLNFCTGLTSGVSGSGQLLGQVMKCRLVVSEGVLSPSPQRPERKTTPDQTRSDPFPAVAAAFGLYNMHSFNVPVTATLTDFSINSRSLFGDKLWHFPFSVGKTWRCTFPLGGHKFWYLVKIFLLSLIQVCSATFCLPLVWVNSISLLPVQENFSPMSSFSVGKFSNFGFLRCG